MRIKQLFLVFIMVLSSFNSVQADIVVEGAGATLPFPLLKKMFDQYQNQKNAAIYYDAVGSGSGLLRFFNRDVDFAATDMFIPNKDLVLYRGEVLHIPISIGALSVVYNLPGNPQIRLTGYVLAEIYLGRIHHWNDPEIEELNPDLDLPDLKIQVAVRQDESGSAYIFSDYLSKVNPSWERSVGRSIQPRWPIGENTIGNEGVETFVENNVGAIGFVALSYAVQNNLKFAAIENKQGVFLRPGIRVTEVSANTYFPKDTRLTITNTSARYGYPITGISWIVIYREQQYRGRSLAQAKQTLDMVRWMINEGQRYNMQYHYAPLPTILQKKANDILNRVTYNGRQIVEN